MPCHRGNGQHFAAQCFFQPLSHFFAAGQLCLGDGDDFRLFTQVPVMQFQLAADHPVIVQGIAAIGRQRLNQVDQHASPLDMPQEFVAQTNATMGAFDQARQIGQDKSPFPADQDQTEVRMLGRKWIVADFRLGAGKTAQQRRFAGIRQADQPGVGNDLQFQDDPAFLAKRAGLEFARGTVDGSGECLVASPASAAVSDVYFLIGFRQIAEDVPAVTVDDQGAGRHGDDDIAASFAVLFGPHAGTAILGAPVLAIDNVGQAIGAGHGADEDAAAVATVAAVRPAARYVLFAPEAQAAAAAVSTLDVQNHAIDEHACIIQALALRILLWIRPSRGPSGPRAAGGQPGHPKHEREPFPPEQVTHFEEHLLDACPCCGGRLRRNGPFACIVQQIDIARPPLTIEQHTSPEYWCARCQRAFKAAMPLAIDPGGLVGPQLTALIAYLKGACHASFSTVRTFLRDVVSVTISHSELSKVVGKVTAALDKPYDELLQALPDEATLNVDETGHKNNGERWWTWCFRAELYTLYRIDAHRNAEVLLATLGQEFAGILGCDYFSAYRRYMREGSIRLQFCLAHLVRDVKFLTTLPDARDRQYGERLRLALKELFAVFHQREQLSAAVFQARLQAARERVLDAGLRRVPTTRHGRNLAKRFRKHGEAAGSALLVQE